MWDPRTLPTSHDFHGHHKRSGLMRGDILVGTALSTAYCVYTQRSEGRAIMGQAATKAAGSAGRAIANNAPSSAAHHRRREAVELAAVIAQGKIKAPTTTTTTTTTPIIDDAATALSAVAARHRRHRDEIAAEMSAAASGRANDGADSGGRGGGGGAARREVGVPEMPPELLKFLTDVGPLRKTLDESATSKRIYDALAKGGTRVRDEHARAANARIRRRMPLVEESSSSSRQRQRQRRDDDTGSRDEIKVIHDGRMDEDDEVDDDGTTVTRTTNFSTVDRSRSSSAHRGRLSVTREDYFRILSSDDTAATIINNDGNNDNLGGSAMMSKVAAVDGGPEWKAAVELEYKKITSTNIAAAATTTATNDTHEDDDDDDDDKDETTKSSSMTFDELRDIKLFEDSLHYIGIPVLMQDNDGDIIGVWSHKVANMRHSSGLKVVTEGSIQFVMKNE